MTTVKDQKRARRHNKVRAKVSGTGARPRLVVFRSLTHTYAQLVDDTKGHVIISSSDLKSKAKGTRIEKAGAVGSEIARLAQEHKISEAVFDRNGYKYHGRVKAVAEGAREGGLKI